MYSYLAAFETLPQGSVPDMAVMRASRWRGSWIVGMPLETYNVPFLKPRAVARRRRQSYLPGAYWPGKVLSQTPEGTVLRLRSMVGHTIVGEMGLYRTLPRGASVRADLPTVAYRLSQEAMTRMEKDDPTLAYAFHKMVIRTLAARVDFANREVASLQR